ncbi:MAG: acyl-CoA thioesterase [Marinicaulis sp.]|nr:acyl-CoA thioesterase [Marinicaulis sp.]
MSDFNFTHPLRVRWAECDAQGIVFNVNYFLYFDVAMTEYLRNLGALTEIFEEFFTVHAEADYKAPARFDEELEIGVRCANLGRTSMTLATEIRRGDEILTTGKLVYVHADSKSREKSPLPDKFAAAILAHENTPPERT